MLSRIMNVDPMQEFRAMDEMFNRFFGQPFRVGAGQSLQTATLPVDVFERDNRLVIRAAVPGVNPGDLDVSVENNVLTIRGETKWEHEDSDTKVYRREVSYGSFARSIRLPDKLRLDQIDAEFKNGFVTISIPKVEEEQPKALKVQVRSADSTQTLTQTAESHSKANNNAKAERETAGSR